MRLLPRKHNVVAFIASWLFFAIVGAGATTQFVLARLIDLGIDIPLIVRVSATLDDIAGLLLTPLFAPIFGVGLLVAMLVGALIVRFIKIWPKAVFALAGFAAIFTTFLLLRTAFDITPIAAARTTAGTLTMCVIGGLAGYIFGYVAERLKPASV